jgi:trimethyllysine dioxygenase
MASRARDEVSGGVLAGARLVGGEVEVSWVGQSAADRFSSFWLRDHCHARESLHPDTLQRQVDTFGIPGDIAPERIDVDSRGATLSIVWKHDGSTSVWPADFLWSAAQHPGASQPPHRRLWDRELLASGLPTMAHAEIMSGNAPLLKWLGKVEEYGFGLATGVPITVEATRELATRIGYVRETIGPHTDGTYSFDSPGFQMFHCLQFDGTGGESTLVDGFKVAEDIRRRDPAAFEVLSSVRVPAQYLGDGVHLRAEHPIIGLDARGELVQIAYNNYDRAPFSLPRARMDEFYRALKIFNGMVNDPANEITMRLAPGTALLFDNWRLLHGRRGYQGYRRLCGAYLNKEDFDSKLRVLRAAR